MPRIPNTHGGGALTNVNGLHFEQTTSLNDALINEGFRLSHDDRVCNSKGVVLGYSKPKRSFIKFLEDNGVDISVNSDTLLPDDAFINIRNKTVYIIEKKFQSVAGSVDEKLQTCLYKKMQYEKLASQMRLLNDHNIIQNESGKDASGSHARKWRLMFAKNGFIYPKVESKYGQQADLGAMDDITPFGKVFLQADTFPAVQECFLRSMSVEQFPLPDGEHYFSPLRWMLALLLEIEKRTGSAEMSRIEFALWGHTTNPSYNLSDVVNHILDLRQRRATAPAKRTFDKQEIKERGKNYDKKDDNFMDYCDMNMRYLRISGMFQRKGRGIMIVPAKHLLAEQLAKSTGTDKPLMESFRELCRGAALPTDNYDIAKSLLDDLMKQLKDRHIVFDISDLPLNTPAEINIARQRLEDLLAKTNELKYAEDQRNQWQEIADYMTLLIKGGGKLVYDEDNAIEIPKDETPAYFEWTLWRAALAIDHMVNKPYEVRGFRLDADFLPVSAAGGGKGDLYCEFEEFTILTEVTMSTSSRQEAMEGEPVRRHVSDAVLKYDKPVYGLFLAIRIDTNTAETFRHGIWYAKGDVKQRLDIVPLTLAQFQKHFVAMFTSNTAHPDQWRDLILQCETERDNLDAPDWMRYIAVIVDQRVGNIMKA